MSDFVSMAQMFPEIVDCRYLHLEMEFFLLNQQQLNSLADHLARQMIALTENTFYTVWDIDGRRVKPEAISEKFLSSTKYIFYGFEGAVLCDLIHNTKTFSKYKRFLDYRDPFEPPEWSAEEGSVDYREFFSLCFADVAPPEGCKEALLRIFNEPGRKKLAVWRNYDISCMFHSCPHQFHEGLYYGAFNFCVAFACLGSQGIAMSEKLANIARQTAQEYVNVNARVALTPCFPHESCSGHRLYFHELPMDYAPIRPDFSPLETRRFLYSPGAEWFNILSPLQLMHVPSIDRDAEKYPCLTVEALPGGGKIVKVKKFIDETDVADLKDVKRLLYNALLPGQRFLKFKDLFGPKFSSYMVKPRVEWELVPIFDDEIKVFSNSVLFHHTSYPPNIRYPNIDF